MIDKIRTKDDLLSENEELRTRLELAENTIHAIQSGEVDAVVVSGPEGENVYTLTGADRTYRILIEAMNEGALVLSPEGVIIYCNRTFAAMLDMHVNQVLGHPIYDFIHDEDTKPLRNMLEQAPLNNGRREINLKRGKTIAVPTLFSIGNIDKEEEKSVSAVVMDLTERKNTEIKLENYQKNLENLVISRTSELTKAYEKLAATEKSLINIINSIKDTFIAITKDWRISYINETAKKDFLGYTRKNQKNLIGNVIWTEFPEIQNTILYEYFYYVMNNNTPKYFEFNYAKSAKWYMISVYPHADGITVYCSDISERKQIERSLKERTIELEESNKELEAFAYSISHDLRAPLRTLDGFSQAILEDYKDILDKTGRDYLQRIRNATQKMSNITEGMLKLSEVIRYEPHWESVSISDMVTMIVQDLKEKDPERDVEFFIAQNVSTRSDPSLLNIALYNLLENAWKFSSKSQRAKIEFNVINVDNEKIYFVKDNGIGFDMKYAQNLYQPFQRLHTDNDFSGHGIGLATVQRVIRRHGGKIWAESEIGKGTTFYFTLGDSDL